MREVAIIGQTISHYKILEELGRGGMGVVYKAEDTKLKRTVALKFLPHHLLTNEGDKTRFLHEAQAASALNHPNIMTIHEIDEFEREFFIAMEYVDGETLKDKLEKRPLKTKELLNIAIAVADGLNAAHEQEIVHRDIKSENIMISNTGMVKIMDFGLAKRKGMSRVTKTGSTLGTLAYMSPEQVEGSDLDRRSDLFSFGVVMYEMATGQLPFKGEHDAAILYSIVNEAPLPVTTLNPNIPQELDRVIHKALEKESEDRYQHADDLAADLRKLKKDLETGKAKARVRETKLVARNRTYLYGGFALLLILLIVGGLSLFTGKSEVIDSIAVLPLENLMGDPEQEFFVDGMTEALITDLSRIGALRVISRTSAMRFKETDKSLPEIARELGVDVVVEGSVLRSKNRVRVSAQLIGMAPERHIWADSYERDLRDILALQTEVARAIAQEIKIAITLEEEASITSARSVNRGAYEAYLKGRFHLAKRTREGMQKALNYFQQSIQQDPDYALVHASLADTYYLLSAYGYLPKDEAGPKAKEAARKALDLDGTLGEAHTVLAAVASDFDHDWQNSKEEFKLAITLSPGYATAHHWYAWHLWYTGQPDKALAEIKRAQELDPLSVVINAEIAGYLIDMRQYDQAYEQIEKALDLDPNFRTTQWALVSLFEATGRYEEAVIKALSLLSEAGASPERLEAGRKAYEEGGYKGYRRWDFEWRIKNISDPPASLMAQYYAFLGEKDQAFVWLDKAYEVLGAGLAWINMDRHFDSLRDDPRFQDLLNRMNLPE